MQYQSIFISGNDKEEEKNLKNEKKFKKERKNCKNL